MAFWVELLYFLTIIGDVMQIVYAGTDFPHKNGEFCQRIQPSSHASPGAGLVP